MAIDSEAKRWAMHAFVHGPAIRNTVANPDTSGLIAIERATVLRYGGTVAFDGPAASATVTATWTESGLVAGGLTAVVVVVNDTLVAAGTGPIGSVADTQALIDGLVSAQSEAAGWNAVRSSIAVTDITRDSDTQFTLTLPALAYSITADETLTWTIPAAVLTGGSPVVASPTITIVDDVGGRKAGRARPKRYVVEVDGQDFIASSIAEVQYLLQQARLLAAEVAERDATRAELNPAIRIKPPRIAVKTAQGKTTSVTLQREVRATQDAVKQIYREAEARIRQIRIEAERRSESAQDEEDAIIALLL